jgi:hypothetical protein
VLTGSDPAAAWKEFFMRSPRVLVAVLVGLSFAAGTARAAGGSQWFVACDGKAENAGTQQAPWDIVSALGAKHKEVQPGDTLWLMGGTYTFKGLILVDLEGTPEKPIIVRNWKNQRVTVRAPLDIAAHGHRSTRYVWIWGLEVQTAGTGNNANPMNIGSSDNEGGLNPGIKIINCLVHDCTVGAFADWGSAEEEAYGNLVYYCGGDGDLNNPEARGHGHGFYIQSKTHKEFLDNIAFRNFYLGYQIYGTKKASFENVTMQGNTFFNNGEVSWHQNRKKEFPGTHVGGGSPANNIKILDNCVYSPAWAAKTSNNVGNTVSAIIRGNYFVSPGPDKRVALDVTTVHPNEKLTVEKNTFVGMIVGFETPDQYGAGNVLIPERPTRGKKIFIRPNKYEPGRANITVFNWDKSPKVDVDLKGTGLKKGDAFEIRDVQDFYGKPAATGKYNGKPVEIPMTGQSTAALIGRDPEHYPAPPHTDAEFGVFVLLKLPKP